MYLSQNKLLVNIFSVLHLKYLLNCFSWWIFQTLLRNYETDIDTLNKQQKQAVEKAELAQQTDMKNANKKLKQEQVCELELSLSSFRFRVNSVPL